ncbi:hypothetical protein CLU83_3236 [Flavobacterium sp. 1]|uniref:hypothetical protein n=1 Tax=Flavobacterium sp. 1 TaxID=2035200 RepID=UPI000CAA0F0F|nr:hypothetical protein [Flavobacterium sp. 1]PJJ09856.1 hypothetical protein CLU83_3236 [Flavobacterium sp. 1]
MTNITTEFLIELNTKEIITISGGQITTETSFWYDAAYYLTWKYKMNFVYGIPFA